MTACPCWSARAGLGFLSFSNVTLLLLGGIGADGVLNDVWLIDYDDEWQLDSSNWIQVAAPGSPRAYFASAIVSDVAVLIGGTGDGVVDGVWVSMNGYNWEERTSVSGIQPWRMWHLQPLSRGQLTILSQ